MVTVARPVPALSGRVKRGHLSHVGKHATFAYVRSLRIPLRPGPSMAHVRGISSHVSRPGMAEEEGGGREGERERESTFMLSLVHRYARELCASMSLSCCRPEIAIGLRFARVRARKRRSELRDATPESREKWFGVSRYTSLSYSLSLSRESVH